MFNSLDKIIFYNNLNTFQVSMSDQELDENIVDEIIRLTVLPFETSFK